MEKEDVRVSEREEEENANVEEDQPKGEVIKIAYPPHLHFLIIDELPSLKKGLDLRWNPHRKGRLWLRGARDQLKQGKEKFSEVLMRLKEQDAIDARKFHEHLVSGDAEAEAGNEPAVVASYGCYKAEAGEEEEEEEEDDEGTVEVVEVEDFEEEEEEEEEERKAAEEEWKPVVVASYSWDMAEEKPKYSIPGYLRTYKAPRCPLKLNAGSVRRETNIEMQPRMELIPLVCSVIDPQFSLLDYDVVTDRNNLRKIFRWACGSTKRWCIDLEKVGPDTIVMTSFDLTEEDEAPCIKERKLRGFRFEDACCQGAESTTSYRAVLAFTKANVNFLMRCEIDATQFVVRRAHCETCLPDPSCPIEYNPHAYPLVDSFVELKSIRKHRFGTDYVKPDDVDQEQPLDDIEMKDIWFQSYIAGVTKIVFGLKTRTDANDEISEVNSVSPAELLKKFQIDPSKELDQTMSVVRFAKEHILRRTDSSHYSLVFEPNDEEPAIRLYERASNTKSDLRLTKRLEEQPLIKSKRRKSIKPRTPIPAYICNRSRKVIGGRLSHYCRHSRAAFTCRNSRRHDCWRLVRQSIRAIQEEDRRKISELIPEGQLSPIASFHPKLQVQQTSGTSELRYHFIADWKALYLIFKIQAQRRCHSTNWWRIDLNKTGVDTTTMDLPGQANPLPDHVFQTVGDGEGTTISTFSTSEINLLVQCATPICSPEVMYRATVTAENTESRTKVLLSVWFQAKLAGVQLIELVPDSHGAVESLERISLIDKVPVPRAQKRFNSMLTVLRSVAKCMADEPIGAQFSLVYSPEVLAIQLCRWCKPH